MVSFVTWCASNKRGEIHENENRPLTKLMLLVGETINARDTNYFENTYSTYQKKVNTKQCIKVNDICSFFAYRNFRKIIYYIKSSLTILQIISICNTTKLSLFAIIFFFFSFNLFINKRYLKLHFLGTTTFHNK